MRKDITVIDNESGQKILAAIEEMNDQAIVQSFKSAITRKLGKAAEPLPQDDSLQSKMERFFDNIFDIAPEEKPLSNEVVIELIDEVIKGLNEEIKDPLSEEYELVEMFQEDRVNYETMKKLIKNWNISEAIQVHKNMDTAPRGRLFGRNYTEQFQLRLWLDQK